MAEFEARLLTQKDHAAWLALWESSARRLVQHPGYAAFDSFRHAATMGVWRGGELVLAVPFHRYAYRGLTLWLTPLFASFSGPLVGAEHASLPGSAAERFWRDAFEALSDAMPGEPDRVEMVLPPGCIDARGLVWRGWEARPHYTYVSEWEVEGGWRDALESSVRRQERKARDAGLRPVARAADETGELERLWIANAKRSHQDADLAKSLAALGRWLAQEKSGFVLEVRDVQKRAHAAALVGFDASRVYYLAGASDPEQLGSGGPTLLQASILEQIDQLGLAHCYDWVGANAPDVARFKRHFGPRVELLIAVARQGRKAQVLETGRKLLKRKG